MFWSLNKHPHLSNVRVMSQQLSKALFSSTKLQASQRRVWVLSSNIPSSEDTQLRVATTLQIFCYLYKPLIHLAIPVHSVDMFGKFLAKYASHKPPVDKFPRLGVHVYIRVLLLDLAQTGCKTMSVTGLLLSLILSERLTYYLLPTTGNINNF